MSPDEKVFHQDEMILRLFPKIYGEWSLPGMRHQVEVVCPDNKDRTLFGAVDIQTGELVTAVFERRRTIEYIQFVDMLMTRNPGYTVNIVCDNCSIHKSKEFQQYQATQPRLKMVYQPTYSFYLNCIELLWLYVRKSVCYNNFFANIEWLVEEVMRFLESLSSERILQAVGMKR